MRAKIKDLTLTELFEKPKKLDFQVFWKKNIWGNVGLQLKFGIQ